MEEEVENTGDTQQDAVNKNIMINEDIPIINAASCTKEHETMEIIKSSLNMLREEIEFLKEEIREKNLLIKILNFRNANDGDKINIDLVEESQLFSLVETTSQIKTNIVSEDCNITDCVINSNYVKNLVDYDDTLISDLNESISNQHNQGSIGKLSSDLNQSSNSELTRESTQTYNINKTFNSTRVFIDNETGNDFDSYFNKNTSIFYDTSSSVVDQIPWEKHSKGFPTRMLQKMGYEGKGLGKYGTGIVKPITVEENRKLGENNTNTKSLERKLLYITSSSMLNQMDGQRLSNDRFEVKVMSHSGCKIRCMYTHLPAIFKDKPDYILMHIGSNDCVDKTSCEVLRDLKKLVEYIKYMLPLVTVIISLPTVRTDSTRSNAVQQNLVRKLKRSYFTPYLDNSTITTSDLGKKGLHFNARGNKKMARNIISLLKCL